MNCDNVVYMSHTSKMQKANKNRFKESMRNFMKDTLQECKTIKTKEKKNIMNNLEKMLTEYSVLDQIGMVENIEIEQIEQGSFGVAFTLKDDFGVLLYRLS